tara:strand:+ start:111 stop:377 length:267 start_codon:yes stop_codon:yes gene_type:complete
MSVGASTTGDFATALLHRCDALHGFGANASLRDAATSSKRGSIVLDPPERSMLDVSIALVCGNFSSTSRFAACVRGPRHRRHTLSTSP